MHAQDNSFPAKVSYYCAMLIFAGDFAYDMDTVSKFDYFVLLFHVIMIS